MGMGMGMAGSNSLSKRSGSSVGSRRSFEKNNHISLDPWRQLARSSSNSSKLSNSSAVARSSGDVMCFSHLFAQEGLKE